MAQYHLIFMGGSVKGVHDTDQSPLAWCLGDDELIFKKFSHQFKHSWGELGHCFCLIHLCKGSMVDETVNHWSTLDMVVQLLGGVPVPYDLGFEGGKVCPRPFSSH